MEQYFGLDVSMEETPMCVMDSAGSVVWEGKAETAPAALLRALHRRAPGAVRVGLESGPLFAPTASSTPPSITRAAASAASMTAAPWF